MLEVDEAPEPGARSAPLEVLATPAPPAWSSPDATAPCRPQQLLALLCKALRASIGGVGVLGSDSKLREYWTAGISGDAALKLQHSAGGAALIQFILEQPAPLRVANFEPLRAELELPDELAKIGPFLGMPLVHHDRPVGALYLCRAHGEPAFTPEDDEVLLPIHEWLAQGDLFEEARLLSQLRLLSQVAQAASGSRDLPTILRVALHELERHLPLHITVVWLLQEKSKTAAGTGKSVVALLPASPESSLRASNAAAARGSTGLTQDAGPTAAVALKLAAASSVPRDRAESMGLKAGMCIDIEQTPFASCVQNGQALYLDLARSDERRSPMIDNLAARGANSVFAVPLRTGQQAVGILQCICTRSAGFTNEQIQILYQVADLLGPAICNCQLFSRLRAAYEELRYTQNQLVKAEKMRALGELASGMAHDFNNALCGALGFLELVLTDPKLDDACRGHLDLARTCTLDAAETVRRVQDFARWQRKEFSVQLVDPNQVVRQTMELARHKWENLKHARGQPITTELITQATAMVNASAAELREVLTNLVFNGVDAMPQGGKLTVRTWNDAENVYLSVADTGIGISESVRHRLFEPFFTTKGERGNGLGLSVTYGIVQRYDGDISVESTLGRGTTFTVRLPHLPAMATRERSDRVPAAAQPQRNAITQDEKAAPKTPARSLHVLIIEDEESIRRFLATGLTHLGHTSRLAADGHAGLALFAEERFDVVLTDLGLPGMSGEEVACNVARRAPQIPVILLTGWSNQLRDAGKPLEGVTRVLGKPVTLATLKSALATVSKA